MPTLAQSFYLDSQFNMPTELSAAGSTLENPYVYDATAKELKAMADCGLVEILREEWTTQQGDELIQRLSFKRLR